MTPVEGDPVERDPVERDPVDRDPVERDPVEAAFGYIFTRPELRRLALTHRSAGGSHNERLEFLGDSILNCCVARMLYDANATADEGDLSRLRATLVSGENLARMAGELGLGDHLKLGSGELKSGGYRRASILADAFEAVLGAIFVDSGFDAASQVIARLFASRLRCMPSAETLKDPKTRLQEWLQARGRAVPSYTLDAVEGEAHAQTFSVTCEVPTLELRATASGGSRRRAEQAAAALVLSAALRSSR